MCVRTWKSVVAACQKRLVAALTCKSYYEDFRTQSNTWIEIKVRCLVSQSANWNCEVGGLANISRSCWLNSALQCMRQARTALSFACRLFSEPFWFFPGRYHRYKPSVRNGLPLVLSGLGLSKTYRYQTATHMRSFCEALVRCCISPYGQTDRQTDSITIIILIINTIILTMETCPIEFIPARTTLGSKKPSGPRSCWTSWSCTGLSVWCEYHALQRKGDVFSAGCLKWATITMPRQILLSYWHLLTAAIFFFWAGGLQLLGRCNGTRTQAEESAACFRGRVHVRNTFCSSNVVPSNTFFLVCKSEFSWEISELRGLHHMTWNDISQWHIYCGLKPLSSWNFHPRLVRLHLQTHFGDRASGLAWSVAHAASTAPRSWIRHSPSNAENKTKYLQFLSMTLPKRFLGNEVFFDLHRHRRWHAHTRGLITYLSFYEKTCAVTCLFVGRAGCNVL